MSSSSLARVASTSSASARDRSSRSASPARAAASTSTSSPSGIASSSLQLPTTSSSSTTRSRHSLYGSEDRVVLDLGSKVWKVGFSGESAPRAVFDIGEDGLWGFEEWRSTSSIVGRRDAERECARLLKKWLRKVYYDELMTDPKARKVIVLENPLLPTRIKQLIAKTLFESLQIPSLSFASSPLCALLSIGRITGLVIDVGHLETTLLPIYSSRPLFNHLRTSPIASRHLRIHLQSLLRRYGIYIPHSSASASGPSKRTIVNPVPESILTPILVEEIQTRACFVMPEPVADYPNPMKTYRINSDLYSLDSPTSEDSEREYKEHLHTRLRSRYSRREEGYEEATDLKFRLAGGTLNVPGWLRHACTDAFFDSVEDVDAPSVPELILDALLKLPIDLRKIFISNILLVGGGSMLPGFPLRLATSLHVLLHREKRYTSLRGLSRYISIINGGTPHSTSASTTSVETARSAAAAVASEESEYSAAEEEEEGEGNIASFSWERALLPWVGASLVGAMKAGGTEEWTREAWDSSIAASEGGELDIGDWTRKGW